jgi:hypothetical protein
MHNVYHPQQPTNQIHSSEIFGPNEFSKGDAYVIMNKRN